MLVLQDIPGRTEAADAFERISNPILVLLLLLLFGILVYMGRQSNTKDAYIKELHTNFADYAIKNTEVLGSLETIIKADSAEHKAIEVLLRENNSFLHTLLRDKS